MISKLHFASYSRTISALCLLATTVACGDTTSGNGEEGKLVYSLSTNYEIAPDDLTQVKLVTGYNQSFDYSYTEAVNSEEMEEANFTNRLVADDGSYTSETCECWTANATEPGAYHFETYYDGELFDRIGLNFDRPSTLDVFSWVRGPFDDTEFVSMGNSTSLQVMEGSQLALLTVPLSADGTRLLGNIGQRISIEPVTAAVRGSEVISVYEEEGVIVTNTQLTVYFVEPGPATITITDPINNVSRSLSVTVSPIQAPETEEGTATVAAASSSKVFLKEPLPSPFRKD